MRLIKWFQNRQRINRRLQWAKLGWSLLLVAFVGCGQESVTVKPEAAPTYQQGQLVDLYIGGVAQITYPRCFDKRDLYWVRVNTMEGPKQIYLHEFEIIGVHE